MKMLKFGYSMIIIKVTKRKFIYNRVFFKTIIDEKIDVVRV